MECVVVQDIFLNETAKYAHVFLPGSSFLEKDGTFTNAERRISRGAQGDGAAGRLCRLGGDAALAKALGYPMNYGHPPRSWPRSPR
jgi:formate dehydrogenase major subunit